MLFHRLTVKNVINETADTVSLVFQIPQDLQDAFRYRAGQYVTLRFMLNGQEERRSYSMSSSPNEKGIKVSVKRVQGGKVSNHINDHIKVGSQIEVMPPAGRFFVKTNINEPKSYYLFGAGSGVTPLMSILKTVLIEEPFSKVFLLYGNRNKASIIFRRELKRLVEQYPDRLVVQHVLSRPETKVKTKMFGLRKKVIKWEGMTGRADEVNTTYFLDQNRPKHLRTEYFICGPNEMMDTIGGLLKEKGIDRKRIHIEYFTGGSTVVDEDEQTEELTVDLTDVHADAQLKATIGNKTVELTIPMGKTVLDALIDAGYDAPYSCKMGKCATCLGKCLDGSLKMELCLTLENHEIEDGLVLTCQSRPTSGMVEVTYDDVNM